MQAKLSVLTLCALAACAPSIPDSARGVGFDNSLDAQRARELALTGAGPAQPLVQPGVLSNETTVPATQPVTAAPLADPGIATATAAPSSEPDDIARDTAEVLAATSQNDTATIQAAPTQTAPARAATAQTTAPDNPAVSDENDFTAVSERRTIQDDAQRLQQSRAQYTVVKPTPVPTRAGSSDPNIVQYALQTKHPRGTRVYSRTGINLAARAQRKCAGYVSADQAQIDFLAKGGPQRDRLGLDPDGDGYACAWNPAPFRQAVRN